MKGDIGFTFHSDLSAGLKSAQLKHSNAQKLALKSMGLQLLNNIVNGSPGANVTPPILTGMLRGSGSVFVGKDFIFDTLKFFSKGTPSRDSDERDENTITVLFNTAYAWKIHEEYDKMNKGAISVQAGNCEGKFIEKHLIADGDELMRLYAKVHAKYF